MKNNNKVILIHQLGKLSALTFDNGNIDKYDSKKSNLSLALEEIKHKIPSSKKKRFVLFSDQVIKIDLPAEHNNSDKKSLYNIARWNLEQKKAKQNVKIGDVLKHWGYVTNDEIDEIITQQHLEYNIQGNVRLGELLVARGKLTTSQLNDILSIYNATKFDVGAYEILIKPNKIGKKNAFAITKKLQNIVKLINEKGDVYIASANAIGYETHEDISYQGFFRHAAVISESQITFSKPRKKINIDKRILSILILSFAVAVAGVTFYKYDKLKKNYNFKAWLVGNVKADEAKLNRIKKQLYKKNLEINSFNNLSLINKNVVEKILLDITKSANRLLLIDSIEFNISDSMVISGRCLEIKQAEDFKNKLSSNKNLELSTNAPIRIVKNNDIYKFTFEYKLVIE